VRKLIKKKNIGIAGGGAFSENIRIARSCNWLGGALEGVSPATCQRRDEEKIGGEKFRGKQRLQQPVREVVSYQAGDFSSGAPQ